MIGLLPLSPDFRPAFPYPYPPHQRGMLIEEFVHHYLLERQAELQTSVMWTYVPVYWSAYAASRPRCQTWRERIWWRIAGWPWERRLQAALRAAMRPGVNYFTVSQHAAGARHLGKWRRPMLEFSSGGGGDIPIPLLCDPHPRPAVSPRREIRASFIGMVHGNAKRYPCREAMVAALGGRPEYLIRHVSIYESGSPENASREFADLMARSVFSLCPRGWGKTSFRLYEAMQFGCIPVYIYDEPWLPYTDVLDWNEFAVLVPLAEAHRLHEILAGYSDEKIRAMQARLAEVHDEFFTMTATARHIVRYLGRHPGFPSSAR